MGLPRFWKDCGRWNDTLMAGTIATMVVLGLSVALGYHLSPLAAALTLFSSLAAGFVAGIAGVAVLCNFFSKG